MIRKMMIYAASFVAACGLNACGQQDVPPAEGSKTGFALSFFKQVNKVSKGSENIVVSPYSAGAALSMLMEGAQGQTLSWTMLSTDASSAIRIWKAAIQ